MSYPRKTASGTTFWTLLAVIVSASCPGGLVWAQRAQDTAASTTPTGTQAMQEASKANQFLFLFCWKEDDANTQKMYQTFQTGVKELRSKKAGAAVASASVNITDPRQQETVKKFGLDRAPMPLVLAIAPNGAVTGGWPIRMSKEQMREAVVSNAAMQTLKALQSRKLVLLCLYHPTKDKKRPAFPGPRAFKATPPYGPATEMIVANMEEDREAPFLKQLRIEPSKTPDSFLLLAPPGNLVAQFASTATKDEIVAKLKAAKSNPCAGGKCGPGGCCGSK